MKRSFIILILGLTAFLTTPVCAEKKPQFGPLQSCYDGPISEGGKGDVKPPHILHTVDPEYTAEARRAGIQGTVVVQIVLTPQGRPCPVKILRGLTTELDQNAVKVIERWTFQPAEKDGKPVASRLTVEVAFRL